MACAAKCTACWLEPHMRLRETAGTETGNPASSAPRRPTFAPCSPAWVTVPQITSSIRAGSSPARDATPLSACASSESGRVSRNAPPRLANGVRIAATMTGSDMDAARRTRRAGRVCPPHSASLLRAPGLRVLGLFVLRLRDREERRPLAEQRLDARFRHEHRPPCHCLLAGELRGEDLFALGGCLVAFFFLLGLRVRRSGGGFRHGAVHARLHVVEIARRRVADPHLVGPAFERRRADGRGLVEARVSVADAGADVGDPESIEGARRVLRLARVEFPRTGERPVAGLRLFCDRPAFLPVRTRYRQGLRALEPHQFLRQPILRLQREARKRLAHDGHALRIRGDPDVPAARQAVGEARHLRFPHRLLAEDQSRNRLAVARLQLDPCPGLFGFRASTGGRELQPRLHGVADPLRLHDLQLLQLQEQVADRIDVSRKAAALLHRPARVAAHERDGLFRPGDRDLGDLVDLEPLQQPLADARVGHLVARAFPPRDAGAGGDERDEDREGDDELLPVHRLPLRRRRTIAIAMPAMATSSGIAPMLTTLVQNSSDSVSDRSSRRTSFSSRRVSAARLRKLSISACCSAVRIAPPAGALVRCSDSSFLRVSVRLSSSDLILPRYVWAASASICFTRVNGRAAVARPRRLMRFGSPDICSTSPWMNARFPLTGIATFWPKMSRICTAAPSLRRSLSPTSTTVVSVCDVLSAGPGSAAADGLSFAPASFPGPSLAAGLPSGKAVLNLPVSLSAIGYSLPSGWKPRTASSPRASAFAESTSFTSGEVCISTFAVRPSAGWPLNTPVKASSAVPR